MLLTGMDEVLLCLVSNLSLHKAGSGKTSERFDSGRIRACGRTMPPIGRTRGILLPQYLLIIPQGLFP
jgi:hypothetical protein